MDNYSNAHKRIHEQTGTTQADFDKTYGVRTDGQVHLGPLNLDCMTFDDLKVARTHPALHSDVRLYAAATLMSRALRLDGKIAAACAIESRLERMYNNLPKACKW